MKYYLLILNPTGEPGHFNSWVIDSRQRFRQFDALTYPPSDQVSQFTYDSAAWHARVLKKNFPGSTVLVNPIIVRKKFGINHE